MTSFMIASCSLWKRELVRFFRQRNRVIGALATPVVFWLLIGAGIGQSFRPEGMPDGATYIEFFFPGTLLMILLFTAIFSTISIIEDRKEGFLQGVLVAPVHPLCIVIGKVLGGASIATIQGVLFLVLAPTAGIEVLWDKVPALIAIIALTSVMLTALGYLIAWPMSSTQGFHAIMNVFLLPLWLFSGALFTQNSAVDWMGTVMQFNPLTYGLACMRRCLYPAESPWLLSLPDWPLSLIVLISVTALLLAGASLLTNRTART